MPVLVKTEPLKADDPIGTPIRFSERAYEEPLVGRGDELFVWVDGGGDKSRLYARGQVLEEGSIDHPKVSFKAVLIQIEPEKPLLYKSHVRPHRDDSSDPTMHELARVVCKNSHKKVTSIDRKVAALLRSHFE